jgi:hypothetical protein
MLQHRSNKGAICKRRPYIEKAAEQSGSLEKEVVGWVSFLNGLLGYIDRESFL